MRKDLDYPAQPKNLPRFTDKHDPHYSGEKRVTPEELEKHQEDLIARVDVALNPWAGLN